MLRIRSNAGIPWSLGAPAGLPEWSCRRLQSRQGVEQAVPRPASVGINTSLIRVRPGALRQSGPGRRLPHQHQEPPQLGNSNGSSGLRTKGRRATVAPGDYRRLIGWSGRRPRDGHTRGTRTQDARQFAKELHDHHGETAARQRRVGQAARVREMCSDYGQDLEPARIVVSSTNRAPEAPRLIRDRRRLSEQTTS